MISRRFSTRSVINAANAATKSENYAKEWQIGEEVHGYSVDKVSFVSELKLTAIKLTHKKTGAQHLHLQRNDPNNVFSVAFKTAPWDSTGVPHILEHTVLCGSRRYPVRDPFFKMMNRSTATYMNAWTASDFTMYPFSAVSWKDMENLRSVYMDAAFFPQLKRLDFRQEGWRLENEKLNDINSPLMFKGVVYNEMKGAFSDTGSLFCQRLQQHIMPNSTYAFVSGGDPKHITDLTHEQLVEFHRKHYHPSNARFYTYGEYPLEKHLEYINETLTSFNKISPPNVKMMPDSLSGMRKIIEYCPPDSMGDPMKQTKISVSFLANNAADSYESFILRILSYLLTSGHASPMYQALIQSNIGSEYAPGTGYDDSTQLSSFSVGLQGIDENDTDKVETIIHDVLLKASREGFDPKRIDAAIHQIELSFKHRTSNFGLGLAQGIASSWIHDSDPVQNLKINEGLDKLRKDMRDNDFFKKKVRKYFIENQNKFVMIMKPDPEYNQNLLEEEQSRLKKIVCKLTPEEKKKLFDENLELAQVQDEKQDISCLPCLKVEEMPRVCKNLPLEKKLVNSVPFFVRVSETNEITYFRSLVTFDDIPPNLRPYVPLFTSSLTNLGTIDKSAAEFDEEIRLNTGGIGASCFLSPFHSDILKTQQGIMFSGNALDRNFPKMLNLLVEAIQKANFNEHGKLKTLILQQASGLMNSVADSGHMYARKFAASSLSPALKYHEMYGGLSQVEWMNDLALNGDVPAVANSLKEIPDFIRAKAFARGAITVSSEQQVVNSESLIEEFLKATQLKGLSPDVKEEDIFFLDSNFNRESGTKTWIKTPFATNFAAKCYSTIPYTHNDMVPLRILSSLMTHHFLHKEIREKNGAYGGGASYSQQDGLFSFYSYRDPNPNGSLDSFDKAIEWAITQNFTDEQMNEAKLTILGQMDAPMSAASEGMLFFQELISDEMRQRKREAVFSATPADVRRVAEKYLLSQLANASTAVIGGQGTSTPTEESWVHKQFK